MCRFKTLLLLIAIWLPIQTAYAVAMPFCRHAVEPAQSVELAATGEHCAVHDMSAGDVDHGSGCDDCGVCHMAGAGYLPAATPLLQPLTGPALVSTAAVVLHSHIGDPPQQPPRHTR